MKDFPICALRSVAFATPDIDRSERFYVDVWGLSVVSRDSDSIYLRACGPDHHVLALRSGARSQILSITFRAKGLADLEVVRRDIEAHGGTIVAELHSNPEPDGGAVFEAVTPEGYRLRFVAGDLTHADHGLSANIPYRLAHVNLNTADLEGTQAFFERALHFQFTDRSKSMSFLRCNSDHHAVVLAQAPVNGLNHVAFLMPDIESVMRGSGRMIDHGFPIAWGVGRHGPGNNVFSYFVDPLGFVIEYTADVLQVDDSYRPGGPADWVWPPGRTDLWGIAPPKEEWVKRAQLDIQFASSGNGVASERQCGELRT